MKKRKFCDRCKDNILIIYQNFKDSQFKDEENESENNGDNADKGDDDLEQNENS